MAKFVKEIGNYRVYELTLNECKEHGRVYPTFVCWPTSSDDIGNMNFTANETGSVEEMETLCKD